MLGVRNNTLALVQRRNSLQLEDLFLELVVDTNKTNLQNYFYVNLYQMAKKQT